MTEQPNRGQPNQQPYPYQPPAQQPGQPPAQAPYPQAPPQQGYQGVPPQQPYQNPYPQQAPGQQPYSPPQQYGAPAPQPYPQGATPQGYPQGAPPPQYPPQQYPGPSQQFQGQPFPGQQFPGQQPYGQPPQGPNQFPGPNQFQGQNQFQGADQAEADPKPKKKRGPWAKFFIVLFSPFIALAFVVYAAYWVLCWLLTPVALVLHFVFCGLGLIWYSLMKVTASGRSKYRLFQPLYPKFPPFWTGEYWVRLNRNVRKTFESLAAIAELLNW